MTRGSIREYTAQVPVRDVVEKYIVRLCQYKKGY